MSLDFSLVGPEQEVECVCSCCYNKHTKKEREEYFSADITHNLVNMADAAELYKVLWRPAENGYKTAAQCVEQLKYGLFLLLAKPDFCLLYTSPSPRDV
jgi:hypothetical protein